MPSNAAVALIAGRRAFGLSVSGAPIWVILSTGFRRAVGGPSRLPGAAGSRLRDRLPCRRRSRGSDPVLLWWPDQGISGASYRLPQRLLLEPGRHCGEYVRRACSVRRMLVLTAGCLCGLFPRGAARLVRLARRRFRVFRAWPALRGVRSTAAAVRYVGVPGPAYLTPPIFWAVSRRYVDSLIISRH